MEQCRLPVLRVTTVVGVTSLFQEEKMKAYRREKRKERKRRARGETEEDGDEEEEDEMDPELAAVMGFSGFGAKKSKS